MLKNLFLFLLIGAVGINANSSQSQPVCSTLIGLSAAKGSTSVFNVYINGEFRPSKSGRTQQVLAPFNGSAVYEVPVCTRDEIDEAFAAAKTAQRSWSRTPLWKWAELLKKAATKLREHADEIAEVLANGAILLSLCGHSRNEIASSGYAQRGGQAAQGRRSGGGHRCSQSFHCRTVLAKNDPYPCSPFSSSRRSHPSCRARPAAQVLRTADIFDFTAEEGVRVAGTLLHGDAFPGERRNKLALVSRVPLGAPALPPCVPRTGVLLQSFPARAARQACLPPGAPVQPLGSLMDAIGAAPHASSVHRCHRRRASTSAFRLFHRKRDTPMTPLAPALFSTMKFCFILALRRAAK